MIDSNGEWEEDSKRFGTVRMPKLRMQWIKTKKIYFIEQLKLCRLNQCILILLVNIVAYCDIFLAKITF